MGCGPRGIEQAQALRSVDGLDLVAVADRAPEAVRSATDALSVPGYLAIEELMERAQPDIVVLATPARGRVALTEQVAAIPGVRAIVAEKPMPLTRSGVRPGPPLADGQWGGSRGGSQNP